MDFLLLPLDYPFLLLLLFLLFYFTTVLIGIQFFIGKKLCRLTNYRLFRGTFFLHFRDQLSPERPLLLDCSDTGYRSSKFLRNVDITAEDRCAKHGELRDMNLSREFLKIKRRMLKFLQLKYRHTKNTVDNIIACQFQT